MTHDHDGPHEHDLGLSHDLPALLNRRRALGLLTGAGLAAALAACSGSDSAGGTTTTSTPSPSGGSSSGGSTATVADEVPAETGGPYPADGSNGVNVLAETGVVRSDIRSSFGGTSTTAEGVRVSIELTVLDLNGREVAPYEGAAVYLWHCDREGRYSMYDSEIADENYLRGVQAADADGRLTFTSIFPAAYPGRWPHMHFEVYRSAADAQKATGKLRTSQLALPEDACDVVYASPGYEQSADTMKQTTLASDLVFSDGHSLQMATVTGTVDDGMTIRLNVAV
ncbi:3,4-dioxygenase subunit beta [Aeromicrobium sp. NPDC092404]|uniref:dioxygenase family protein n=1 Tax=Aeromicrobium sp. NPDC092404 TaxID=3154976 RepID=UPI0034154C24